MGQYIIFSDNINKTYKILEVFIVDLRSIVILELVISLISEDVMTAGHFM